MSKTLLTFPKGGVHPRESKELTEHLPIETLPVPEEVVRVPENQPVHPRSGGQEASTHHLLHHHCRIVAGELEEDGVVLHPRDSRHL